MESSHRFETNETKGWIVAHPYEPSANPLSKEAERKWLVVSGIWDEGLVNFINANKIDALYLNYAKGWLTRDYSFLSNLQSIKGLHILSVGNNVNLNAIEEMPNLSELSITASPKYEIDFSKMKNLRQCFLSWWPEAESIFSAHLLTDLALDEMKIKDASVLSKLTSLKRLALSNTNIVTLDFLAHMEKLEILELLNCRKVLSFEPIAFLNALKWMRIDGTKRLPAIEFVTDCHALEILTVSDCGEIESLRPVESIRGLKAIAFAGNTKILDGDLSILTSLPKLSMLMFASRRHYSHELIKKWNWSNFGSPDTLLKAKA